MLWRMNLFVKRRLLLRCLNSIKIMEVSKGRKTTLLICIMMFKLNNSMSRISMKKNLTLTKKVNIQSNPKIGTKKEKKLIWKMNLYWRNSKRMATDCLKTLLRYLIKWEMINIEHQKRINHLIKQKINKNESYRWWSTDYFILYIQQQLTNLTHTTSHNRLTLLLAVYLS